MYATDLSGLPPIDDYPIYPTTSDGCSTTGFKARDWTEHPLCGVEGTIEFPQELILSRQELRERIEEQDKNESSLWHILKRGPKIWRNQSPSNYCWMYGPVHGMQAARIWANLPPVMLSPLSAGCPCDNFRNRGGWGQDAINWLIKNGVCEESVWPSANVNGGINRKYYTDEAKANALKYRIPEWYDFKPRDFMAKASAVVRGIAVSSGYNHMGHQMCTIRIVALSNGSFGCVDLDSYGRNGEFSQQSLSESRGDGDDSVAPRVST
jgi:hypothetical protein